MSNILFLGTGITGALAANILHSKLQNCNISLWDKAKGVGGRLSTSRSTCNPGCFADLGAQYLTRNSENYKPIYDSLLSSHIITPLVGNIEGLKEGIKKTHFVAPLGMSSIVKHLVSVIAPDKIQCNQKVNQISIVENEIRVSTEHSSNNFDAVIITIPVPQIIELQGINSLLSKEPEILTELQKVTYSTRFALILFYDDKDLLLPSWSCKYLDHTVFRYVAIDNMKRGQKNEPVAVVFHTSVKFGFENISKTTEEMKMTLINSVRELFPNWTIPENIKVHKWRYSQVQNSYKNKPGCIILRKQPLLILGGDGFSESNFDGCIHSSETIVNHILQNLSN